MFPEEALWIRDELEKMGLPDGATVVDVGSSTDEYRRLWQPHVDFYVMRPLRQRGVRIVHVDAKSAPGVDVTYDVSSTTPLPAELRGAGDVVLCASIFEHVLDRAALARRLEEILAPAGTLIVTVPHVYPFHADPIDTMYRPAPHELAELFPSLRCEHTGLVLADLHPVTVKDDSTYRLARHFARVLIDRVRDRVQPPARYEVSVGIFRQPG